MSTHETGCWMFNRLPRAAVQCGILLNSIHNTFYSPNWNNVFHLWIFYLNTVNTVNNVVKRIINAKYKSVWPFAKRLVLLQSSMRVNSAFMNKQKAETVRKYSSQNGRFVKTQFVSLVLQLLTSVLFKGKFIFILLFHNVLILVKQILFIAYELHECRSMDKQVGLLETIVIFIWSENVRD